MTELGGPFWPRAGDFTHSKAVFQCRVAMNAMRAVKLQEKWGQICNLGDEGQYAFPYGRNISDGTKGVIMGELCFAMQMPPSVEEMYVNDKMYELKTGEPVCFSSLNGMPCTDQALRGYNPNTATPQEKHKIKSIIRKQIRFVGLAGTDNDHDYIYKEQGRADFPVLLGGVYSIINTGDKPIMAGQMVLWDVPDPFFTESKKRGRDFGIQGTDDSKVLAMTVPYEADRIDVENFLDGYQLDVDVGEGHGPNIYMLMKYREHCHEYQSRVIGVALTDAMPGCQFDIQQCSYMI